jgi:hypothetical protein
MTIQSLTCLHGDHSFCNVGYAYKHVKACSSLVVCGFWMWVTPGVTGVTIGLLTVKESVTS